MNAEPSPRPWSILGQTAVVDPTGALIADVFGPQTPDGSTAEEANANLIVRAVNAHDVMLAALGRVANCVGAHCDGYHRTGCDCVGEEVRAAIAIAVANGQ